jgi:hypothetical protein
MVIHVVIIITTTHPPSPKNDAKRRRVGRVRAHGLVRQDDDRARRRGRHLTEVLIAVRATGPEDTDEGRSGWGWGTY